MKGAGGGRGARTSRIACVHAVTQAAQLYEHALSLAETIADQQKQCALLEALGWVMYQMGDMENAVRWTVQTCALYEAM